MSATFVPVTSVEQLRDLIKQSDDAPVLVYNHDPYCPICARAHTQLEQIDGDVYMINVSTHHAERDELARASGVKHESPQAIVFAHGDAVWNASHYAITKDVVTSELAAAKG